MENLNLIEATESGITFTRVVEDRHVQVPLSCGCPPANSGDPIFMIREKNSRDQINNSFRHGRETIMCHRHGWEFIQSRYQEKAS